MNTTDKIKAIINKRYNDEQTRLNKLLYIRSFLAKYDGKKITKHIINALLKQHPDWNAYLSHSGSLTYLVVWGGSTGITNSGNADRYFLSYNSTYEHKEAGEKSTIEYIEECQAKRVKMLANEERLVCLGAAIDQFNAAKAQLKEYMAADWVEDGGTIHEELIGND